MQNPFIVYFILMENVFQLLQPVGSLKLVVDYTPTPLPQEQVDINVEDETEDGFEDEEEDLGAVEEERSVILHLLSQLKLGMDLTRVAWVPRTACSRDFLTLHIIAVEVLTLRCFPISLSGLTYKPETCSAYSV